MNGARVTIIMWFCILSLWSSAQDEFSIIAHRGASAIAPENTLISFETAIDAGANYVEMDIRQSADDSIMVIHDKTLERTTNGSGDISEMPYNLIRNYSAGYPEKFGQRFLDEKIPTLFEALALCKNRVKVCIELKDVPEMPVLEMVRKMEMSSRTVFMSYNPDKLSRLHEEDPGLTLVLITNLAATTDLYVAASSGFSGIATSVFTPACYMKEAEERGLFYWAGVVNDPGKADQLRSDGADGVLTGDPGLILQIRRPELLLSPNPFREEVKISILAENKSYDIVVFDVQGKVILRSETDSNEFRWKPVNCAGGIYFLYIPLEGTFILEKLIYSR